MSGPQLTPSTLLSGFLGAGKTSLLSHLLSQAQGRRLALVVNDVGAINLDARLVESARRFGSGELVELSNGCVCCSGGDNLAETLCRLGAEGRHDHVIVESTGVAEPRALATLFHRRNLFGRSVSDFLTLSALVTVVDSADFLRRWDTRDASPSTDGRRRPLMELLLEQVECADLLVLNKADLLPPEDLSRLETLLLGLNPHAQTLSTEQGQAPIEWLLDRRHFSQTHTLAAARWISELNTLVPPMVDAPPKSAPKAQRSDPEYTRRYGLRTFSFQARLPFRREAFMQTVANGFPGIVRAKGFYWLAENPDEMSFLSLAGGLASHTVLKYWWAAIIQTGKATLEDRPPLIRALWEEPAGDRRQELVFIGADHDEPAIRRALEACLVK